MKKFLVIVVTAVALAFGSAQQANAQGALGLRLGGGTWFGGELSYLTAMDGNRWELDLGFGAGHNWSHVCFTGAYQWDWNIVAGLNWFVGPAAQVNLVFAKNDLDLGIGIGGQIGLEYDFSDLGAPIQLSLDARPMWVAFFMDHYDYYANGSCGFGWGAALGIRYVF